MLNRIFKSGLIGFFALVMAATFTSCKKEKETIGIIIVKNNNNQVVPNASVTLSPEQTLSSQGEIPDQSLTKTNPTDANGQAEFTYELEAILNISILKVEGNTHYTGANIIRLQKGKIITKVVVIN